MLWRQGDIYIETIDQLPPAAIVQPDVVLAEGEATGHQHRIEDPLSAIVFDDRGQLYLNITADRARLVHDEHAPIVLLHGLYRVWRQREYDPTLAAFSRIVQD
jgi:hypothetical protein